MSSLPLRLTRLTAPDALLDFFVEASAADDCLINFSAMEISFFS